MKISIKTRILLYTLLTATTIYIIVIIFNSINYKEKALENAKELADIQARENANLLKNQLDKYMIAARTVTQTFTAKESIPPLQRRTIYMDMLKKLLEENPDYLAIWTIWEPNTLDELDSLFINAPGCTWIGSFSTTYYRGHGKIELESSEGFSVLFAGDYYTIPKARLKETLMEPYYYSYSKDGNDSILQTNIIIPIIIDNSFKGVVGIDVELEKFQELTDKLKPYETGHAFILSADAAFVAHPNRELVGKSLSEVNSQLVNRYDIVKNIQSGKQFSYIDKNLKNNEESYITFAPLTIGQSETYWTFGVAVPIETILLQSRRSIRTSVISGLIGIGILYVIIWFITQSIINPLKKIALLLKDLNKENIAELKKVSRKFDDVVGDIAESTSKLIQWINRTGRFARHIGKGNFNAEYRLFNENDELGKALLDMRQSLYKSKQKEDERIKENEIRNWTSQGVARFAELLRHTSKSMEEYTYSIICELINFLKVNQGGFFILNDENEKEVYIELIAAYAYNRRRFFEKKINIGEGLVGMCVIEKQTVYLTEIPDEYISITSGLGKANPSCILIVPLIFNNEVFGVIEIASFNKLKDYEIDFTEKICENIASAISSLRINIKTAKLLEESKHKSEELTRKEEEMRQNIEEMMATHEDYIRREKAYKEELEAAKKEIEYLRNQINKTT